MFKLFKRGKKNRKVVVLGLDGVPHSLLVDYMDAGIMPELSGLCDRGSL